MIPYFPIAIRDGALGPFFFSHRLFAETSGIFNFYGNIFEIRDANTNTGHLGVPTRIVGTPGRWGQIRDCPGQYGTYGRLKCHIYHYISLLESYVTGKRYHVRVIPHGVTIAEQRCMFWMTMANQSRRNDFAISLYWINNSNIIFLSDFSGCYVSAW